MYIYVVRVYIYGKAYLHICIIAGCFEGAGGSPETKPGWYMENVLTCKASKVQSMPGSVDLSLDDDNDLHGVDATVPKIVIPVSGHATFIEI